MGFSARFPSDTRPTTLSLLAAAKKKDRARLFDLTESNPTKCGFDHSFVETQNFASLRYDPDPRGLLSAREAICRYYAEKSARIRPEHVFLCASTSEAYHYLFRLLCDAGQSVACAQPSYPLFDSLAALDDVVLKKYRLSYDGRWTLDGASLKEACAGVRAVLAVHPNNPTGHFILKEEQEMFGDVCSSQGAALISDEVFLDFAWDGKDRETFADSAFPTFTLSGISKILGLPQMKLSWIVVGGPEAYRREACDKLETIADAYLSVNTPAQQALPSWLALKKSITGEISKRVRANRAFLEKEFGAAVLKAEGGWHSILRFNGPGDDEQAALSLLKEQDVLVQPGYLYDLPFERSFVLSLLPEEKIFREGLQRLKDSLYK